MMGESSVGKLWVYNPAPSLPDPQAAIPQGPVPPILKEWLIEITKVATETATAACKDLMSEVFEKQCKKNNLVIVGWP